MGGPEPGPAEPRCPSRCRGPRVHLDKGHGRVDYLLFVNRLPLGVIEAKPEGTTLTEVEHQSGKYVSGLPSYMKPPVYPLPHLPREL